MAATPKTIRTVVRVGSGAAAADRQAVGSRYGSWATPQPQTTAITAAPASGRSSGMRRISRTRTAMPQSAERMTSGRPQVDRRS